MIGASGDLAQKKTFPALFKLHLCGAYSFLLLYHCVVYLRTSSSYHDYLWLCSKRNDKWWLFCPDIQTVFFDIKIINIMISNSLLTFHLLSFYLSIYYYIQYIFFYDRDVNIFHRLCMHICTAVSPSQTAQICTIFFVVVIISKVLSLSSWYFCPGRSKYLLSLCLILLFGRPLRKFGGLPTPRCGSLGKRTLYFSGRLGAILLALSPFTADNNKCLQIYFFWLFKIRSMSFIAIQWW